MKKRIAFLFSHLSSSSIFPLLFFLFCLLFSTWLMFRTFSYDGENQAIEIAGKCWSDFGAHIPLIRSFSLGGNFDRVIHFQLPEYPIYPGAPIRYHFLFYMIVGIMEKIGIRIDWALNIPSILSFTALLLLIYYLARTLYKGCHCEECNNEAISMINLPAGRQGSPHPFRIRDDNARTSWAIPLLSVIFFLFNGSLSFLRFFEKHPLSLTTPLDIIKNTEFPSFGPWDNGLVSAFWNLNIYTNQRHLALGFALVLGCLTLVLCIRNKPWKKQLPYLFITVPLLCFLPFLHQPMLLVLGLFLGWYFLVFPTLRVFLFLTAVLSEGPVLAQLFLVTHAQSQFAWYPGYLIHGQLTPLSFVQYWFHNLGLHMMLIPIGFFLVPWKIKKVFIPMFFLFIIANCFKFSVEIAANHKFFNFFMVFGNMLSAYTIVSLFSVKKPTLPFLSTGRQLSAFSYQIMQKVWKLIAICCCLILTLSGIIDFFAVANDNKIQMNDIPKHEIATWFATNTPKNAIILNTSYLYNPASIAGRSIFLGWPYFAWSAGYEEDRMPILKKMYETRDVTVFCSLIKKYAITHITVEKIVNDPDLPTIDPSYFRSITKPVFTDTKNTYDIYTKQALCPEYEVK